MDETGHTKYDAGSPQDELAAQRAAADAQWDSAAPTSRWTQPPMRVGVIAALCLIGFLIWSLTRPKPHTDVFGTLTLSAGAFISDGTNCAGDAGFGDIAGGVAVTVGGPNGQTLAVGGLDTGVVTVQGDCVFSFDVQAPAGQSLYTVTISHRGTQTFTPAQVAAGIALTLGQ